ncbi:MAG: pyridoxal-phosphate dependent enzyme [Gammaproteobacteria bacterium]|nr:pyridoxal-phosphate dependent enzyme [Gammaproteobacteria bacterium]
MLKRALQNLQQGLDLFFLDALHPDLGNKYYKLSANLEAICNSSNQTVVSFGGAWSNHLLALARLGREYGLNTVGIVRGERADALSATLQDAEALGMRLLFITRASYQQKQTMQFRQQLEAELGEFALLPEGGSNQLAVQGCTQIIRDLANHKAEYDTLILPVGTGGTIAGCVQGADRPCEIIGISVLKGAHSLDQQVTGLIETTPDQVQWKILHDYHMGGYAKCPPALTKFVRQAEQQWNVLLDPVYTGKALMATLQLRAAGVLAGKKVVFVHTGGLQGRRGFSALG